MTLDSINKIRKALERGTYSPCVEHVDATKGRYLSTFSVTTTRTRASSIATRLGLMCANESADQTDFFVERSTPERSMPKLRKKEDANSELLQFNFVVSLQKTNG